MSQVKISGDASGTGTLTVAAPNTNSNFTLTLPAATGTFNTSGVVNEVPAGTAALPAITTTGDTNTGIFFPAADTIAFSEGGVEAMRIDSSGRVILGDTTADGRLKVLETAAGAGVTFYNSVNNSAGQIGTTNEAGTANSLEINAYRGSGRIVFKTNNTYAASIDSSGNLLVGTTGLPVANGKLAVDGTARFFGTGDGPSFGIDKSTSTTTTSQVFAFFSINNQTTGSGQINANGPSQAAFGSFSDVRLKQNIVDLPPQLENICALRPVEFDYIASEGSGHQISFIAQEFEEIYPDAIGERSDGMKTLTGWSKTEARLVKAIQEQQALITALTARITALEQT